MLRQYADLLSALGFQWVWELRKHTYSDEFRQFVEQIESGEYRLK